jgi:hypothetical protein
MRSSEPVHPVDTLTEPLKCRIYYARVVDLAVAGRLLSPNPASPIGHFVFSSYYLEGKNLDRRLEKSIHIFQRKYPAITEERRRSVNNHSLGAAENFLESSTEEKIRFLILIGAGHYVWPTGTSFVLTYPWDLSCNPAEVTFRSNLTEFQKKRVVSILKKAGKFGNGNIFVS